MGGSGRAAVRLRRRLQSSWWSLGLVLATLVLLFLVEAAAATIPSSVPKLAFWSSVQYGVRGGSVGRWYPVHFALTRRGLGAATPSPSVYRVDFGDGSGTVTAPANATVSHAFERAGRFTVRFHAYSAEVAPTIGGDVNVTDPSVGYVFPPGGEY